jgi:hypothetical protein
MQAKSITRSLWLAGIALSLGLAAVEQAGCTATTKPEVSQTQPAATTEVVLEKGGAQMWADTCMHCHNLRPPTSMSRVEWQMAVQHMRLRAPLTGEEQRKITEFLESAK